MVPAHLRVTVIEGKKKKEKKKEPPVFIMKFPHHVEFLLLAVDSDR